MKALLRNIRSTGFPPFEEVDRESDGARGPRD